MIHKSIIALCLAAVAGQTVANDPLPTNSLQPPSMEMPVDQLGFALMDYAERLDRGWADEAMRGRMTLIDAKGRSVEREFVRLMLENAEEGDKVMIRFTQPTDIRGVSALTYEKQGALDDNWLYLPSTKRVRRISGANNTSSFQGTEFTFEDLSAIDPVEYNFTYMDTVNDIAEGISSRAYLIHAVPTYDDTNYSHLEIYLGVENWQHLRIDYFDRAGKLLKRRLATEYTAFNDRFWRAQRVDMRNLQTGKRTVLEMDNYRVDLKQSIDPKTGNPRSGLSARQFTTRALEK